jgi:molybdate transport system regulatory protein
MYPDTLEHMSGPHTHIRIDFSGTCSLGPGKISLLEGVQRAGSLAAAARVLGMSYRRAWLLLNSMNAEFSEPVAELSAGGEEGGGAQLTEFGGRLVADYRQFEAAVEAMAAQSFAGVAVSGKTAEIPAPRRRLLRTRTTRRTG